MVFYTYTLSRPGGHVFYVGKGSGRRIDSPELEAKRAQHTCPKCAVIREIQLLGGHVQKVKVLITENEEEAFIEEERLIRWYGLKNLTNRWTAQLHRGGAAGVYFSPEHRKKIGDAARSRPHPPLSQAHRQKLSLAGRGKKRSEETKRRLSDALKKRGGRPLTQTHKQHIGEGLRGRVLSPEHRARLGERKKRYWAEWRQRRENNTPRLG